MLICSLDVIIHCQKPPISNSLTGYCYTLASETFNLQHWLSHFLRIYVPILCQYLSRFLKRLDDSQLYFRLLVIRLCSARVNLNERQVPINGKWLLI